MIINYCSCVRSWKFWLSLAGLVLLIGLVFGLWADVKGHVRQIHGSVIEDSDKMTNDLKETLSKKLVGMKTRELEKMGLTCTLTVTVHTKNISDLPVNCEEVYEHGSMTNGDYTIDSDGKDHGVAPFNVHCDFDKYSDFDSDSYSYVQRATG